MLWRSFVKQAILLAAATNAEPIESSTLSPRAVESRGTTRRYDFTVSRGTIAPDGVKKPAILVNNQFPGPSLEANYGDTFEITVHNNIHGPNEGTGLHWHGLLHRGIPWADGTPASQICPIAPGDSFTYSFTADSAGSSWWHSHFSAQHADGLKGPLIIKGPTSAPYDIDIGAIFISDNYHGPYTKGIQEVNSIPLVTPFADSNLINGKGQYNCTLGKDCPPNTPYSKFKFQSGKTHLLRVINAGADGIQCFAVDGHSLNVIATDFTPVTPYTVNCVSLHVGQRADVLVKGVGKANSSYFMRANISAAGTLVPVPALPATLAAVYYEQADQNKIPSSSPDPAAAAQCGSFPLDTIHPATSKTPPAAPATTETILVTLGVNASGNELFYQNGVSFRGNYNYPILLLAKTGNTSYPNPQWNVYNFGSNSSTRIVMINQTPLVHPIHLHGHQFWILASGTGVWDGTVTNPSNPARRDTGVLPAEGYLVIEWIADNPGVWPLHCHIAWHSSPGFFLNVLEQPNKLRQLHVPPTVAGSIKQLCRNWWTYTQHDVVDQIDSGL